MQKIDFGRPVRTKGGQPVRIHAPMFGGGAMGAVFGFNKMVEWDQYGKAEGMLSDIFDIVQAPPIPTQKIDFSKPLMTRGGFAVRRVDAWEVGGGASGYVTEHASKLFQWDEYGRAIGEDSSLFDIAQTPDTHSRKRVREDGLVGEFDIMDLIDDEEPTITEGEKAPFPELGDIEEFTGPEWIIDIIRQARYLLDQNRFEQYAFSNLKLAYENGVPVTWKPKEKINRKLHEDRYLAMAIGRWILEKDTVVYSSDDLSIVGVNAGKTFYFVRINDGRMIVKKECTLPDDYIIPEQVIEWRKEYEEKGL